jgi:magnesium transporter
MIPTLIASFFGMNVPNFMESSKLAFTGIFAVAILITVSTVLLFRRKKWM